MTSFKITREEAQLILARRKRANLLWQKIKGPDALSYEYGAWDVTFAGAYAWIEEESNGRFTLFIDYPDGTDYSSEVGEFSSFGEASSEVEARVATQDSFRESPFN